MSRLWMLIPALLLVAPVDADAKGRGRGRGHARETGVSDRGRTDVDDRNGNGPPFCRNGAGHPVHGWEWCREKGWDRADRDFPWWERDDRRDDRDGDRDGDRDRDRDRDGDRRSRVRGVRL